MASERIARARKSGLATAVSAVLFAAVAVLQLTDGNDKLAILNAVVAAGFMVNALLMWRTYRRRLGSREADY